MVLSAYDKIIRAKVQLQSDKPFFSYLVMNMKIKEEESIPSMAVDARGTLYYNPEWVSKLPEDEVQGVIVHEVMHVVLQHLLRLGSRNAEIHNWACDMVINDMLVSENISLPSQGIIPNRNHEYEIEDLNYTVCDLNKKTAEEVYDELYKLFSDNKGKGGCGDAEDDLNGKQFDEHIFGDGDEEGPEGEGNSGKGAKLSKAELEKVQREWREKLAEASSYAQQRGLLPAGMEMYIDILLEGKVEWRHKLYKYITSELPYDFTYNRPSKKSISTGVYMPSVLKEKIEIVVAVDTSGSIQQKELSEFLSEIVSISNSFSNIEMDLLVCDAEIHNHYKVNNATQSEILALKIQGGGGTSHRPIVDWINDEKPNAKVLVCLTDGYSDIEEVFDDLPNNTNRIIVLNENGCSEKDMEDCGEVIKL